MKFLSSKYLRGDRDFLRFGVVSNGKLTRFDCDRHEISGAGFSGEKIVFLESGNIKNNGVGYTLKIEDGDGFRVVEKNEEDLGYLLRASPDGRRIAFLLIHGKERRIQIRIVDLKSGEGFTTAKFRSDDFTFDGAPLFYWDPRSEGVYLTISTGESGKRPYALRYLNATSQKMASVIERENVTPVAVLDEGHFAVFLEDEGKGGNLRSGVLRLRDRKIFPLPRGSYILGGRGRNLTIMEMKSPVTYTATFTLPSAK